MNGVAGMGGVTPLRDTQSGCCMCTMHTSAGQLFHAFTRVLMLYCIQLPAKTTNFQNMLHLKAVNACAYIKT